MNWLLSQPMVIAAVGAGLLVLFFFVLQQTGKRWVIGAMVAVLIGTLAMVGIERYVVTPEEEVKLMLKQIAADAQANDIEAVCGHLSRRAPELETTARALLRPVTLERVEIKRILDLNVQPNGKPPHALAHIRVLAVGGDKSGTINNQRALREFELRLVKEDDRWKVRGYEEIDIRESLRGEP